MKNKYIFVTGGVCSSLGKGIAAASLGCILEGHGLNIRMIKIDPYINVDAGTMSPYQHGEVYVTDDGAETDLDLGNYARFTHSPLSQDNSITTGQVYREVIRKEREGKYLGKTVQVIPHVTDEIKKRIIKVGEEQGVDVTIVEIGGTVGDIESIPFLEASRQFSHDFGRDKVIFVHLTLVPTVTGGELKTKPTQHSTKELREIGIQPDVLLCRSAEELGDELRRKIALFTNVEFSAVISACDVNSTIYEIPLVYSRQGLDDVVLKKLGLKCNKKNLANWSSLVRAYVESKKTVKIGIVGKYLGLHDTYKSVFEALVHGGIANKAKVDIIKIDSESLFEEGTLEDALKGLDGILVPGGFGERGTEGKVAAVTFARTNKIPYFGICLGMQMMVIEYSRSILKLERANSTEMDPRTPHPVVSLLEEQIDIKAYGGTMRLGKSRTKFLPGTKIASIYNTDSVEERHRHRYEVSNLYKKRLEDAGLIIGGVTPDNSLVESVEWKNHPWGVGVQYHPEFTSKPVEPNPLFASFVAACVENDKK